MIVYPMSYQFNNVYELSTQICALPLNIPLSHPIL